MSIAKNLLIAALLLATLGPLEACPEDDSAKAAPSVPAQFASPQEEVEQQSETPNMPAKPALRPHTRCFDPKLDPYQVGDPLTLGDPDKSEKSPSAESPPRP